MELVFACESRFISIEGRYYADSPSFGDALWRRYLRIFDRLIIFARVKIQEQLPVGEDFFEIVNPNVSFIDVPYYVGPKEYLKEVFNLKKMAKQSAVCGRAYICRVPGKMGSLLSSELRKKDIPYAVEVVGDPWDVFAPGAIKHPLAPFFRLTGFITLKNIVAKAKAVLYVTKHQLQKRYPASKGSFETYASNVILKNEYMTTAKQYNLNSGVVRLLAIGSLAQMYKSPDVAIETVAKLKTRGVICLLTWLGDGKYKDGMQRLAKSLSVDEHVVFAGNVSFERVREELNKADIFLHISRTEGLPRAVVEAMGAGLPCVGSRVGGIPELLEDIALVDEIKADVVADKIQEFITNKELIHSQAERNLLEAKLYLESTLNQRREQFYNEILMMTVK